MVTASSKKQRMERYISAGDLDLSSSDIHEIDEAGRITTLEKRRKYRMQLLTTWSKKLVVVVVGILLLHLVGLWIIPSDISLGRVW